MTIRSASTVIDSHLHVWADDKEASAPAGYPYAEGHEPPENLRNQASISALLRHMDANGIDGALIVQPINHKFDHAYVMHALKSYPTRFKGMLLHDPSLPEDDAVSRLEQLALGGFVGVRFNPYLWPKRPDGTCTPMSSTEAGLAVYRRCGELHMPVGVMCFQGLHLHFQDILTLIQTSPATILILDHVGFTTLTQQGDADFAKLLMLAEYPQVIVKVSALFRLNDVYPYSRVYTERFQPLLQAFGPDRLMFGTDFPFVMDQPESYAGTIQLLQSSSWMDDSTQEAVMHGTAERLFGLWGTVPYKDN